MDKDHFVIEEWFGKPGELEELIVVLHHARKGADEALPAATFSRLPFPKGRPR